MTRTVRFGWVDVFARTPLTGNPLPVVPDADELTTDEMISITREFNQSETTFLLTPADRTAHVRLRSFTPGGVEVGGAGHNAMGAWIWLASTGALPADRTEFVQQIGDLLLPVRVSIDDGVAHVSMTQSAPRFLGSFADRAALAAALSLEIGDLSLDVPAIVASTGAEHLLVSATRRTAVDRAAPDSPALRALLAAAGGEGCYLYSTESGADDVAAYARFFNPTVGIAEDPATGTAAGPLAALLVRDSGGTGTIRIEQGRAMGRPSVLEVRLAGDEVSLVGAGIVVAEGVLHL